MVNVYRVYVYLCVTICSLREHGDWATRDHQKVGRGDWIHVSKGNALYIQKINIPHEICLLPHNPPPPRACTPSWALPSFDTILMSQTHTLCCILILLAESRLVWCGRPGS